MVLLHMYEGDYAIDDVHGGGTKLGIKLNTFNDPVVGTMKRFLLSKYDRREHLPFDISLAHILQKDKNMEKLRP